MTVNKYIAVCLFLLSNSSFADWYGQIQLGLVVYKKPSDGDWHQKTHDYKMRLQSGNALAGIGYRFDKWAVETNYRYLAGGSIKADLEFDVTYFTPSAPHDPVQFTRSSWFVRGPSIDILRHFGNAYIRYGVMWQTLSWTIDVQATRDCDPLNPVDCDGIYPRSIQSASDMERRPVFGLGYNLNDTWHAEAAYYPLRGGRGISAVTDAITLNVGVRF